MVLPVPSTHETGRRFERAAERHLVERGWTVLERNLRFGRREVDLVVLRHQTVAFVEVKGRAGAGFGHPLEAVTARKRAEVQRVALWWVARNGRPNWSYRFDAVAVFQESGGSLEVIHVEDAWRMEG